MEVYSLAEMSHCHVIRHKAFLTRGCRQAIKKRLIVILFAKGVGNMFTGSSTVTIESNLYKPQKCGVFLSNFTCIRVVYVA